MFLLCVSLPIVLPSLWCRIFFCHLLLFALCSSVFLVATLTIEILNNMHMLVLQSQEMSWKELLIYHLGIAKTM